MIDQRTADLLNQKYLEFNQPHFIDQDPVQIPKAFDDPRDAEIMGLLAAILAWGQRKTIITKCLELVDLFRGQPYDFVMNFKGKALEQELAFKHRTFNAEDLQYILSKLNAYYQTYSSLESLFSIKETETDTYGALSRVHDFFFAQKCRTQKHISDPRRNSTCKRLNMYLRWMVRDDQRGVDLGIWKAIPTSKLVIPVDIHVANVSQKLGLMPEKKIDWHYAIELTNKLKQLDKNDPVKYDFALFGMGVSKFLI